VSMLVLVISVPFLAAWLLIASVVDGEEFSPDTFETRRFRYYRIPVIGAPLTNREIEDSSSVLAQALLGDGYIQPPATKTNRWDLIRENWQHGISSDLDAVILDTYLKISSDGHDSYWSGWNEKYPHRAPEFWQVIAGLARANQYVLMPDLFRLAMAFPEAKAGDEDPFQAELHRIANRLLLDQANRFRESGDNATANELEQLASSLANPAVAATPAKTKTSETSSGTDAGEGTGQ